MIPLFAAGQIAKFEYPESNKVGLDPRYRSRTVLVEEVREFAAAGFHPETIARRPMTNRGRWLIVGTCLDSGEPRMFYFESMRHARKDSWLTLGLYDPIDENCVPVYHVGRFAPTRSDREYLFEVIREYGDQSEDRPHAVHSLSVFPVENLQ